MADSSDFWKSIQGGGAKVEEEGVKKTFLRLNFSKPEIVRLKTRFEKIRARLNFDSLDGHD